LSGYSFDFLFDMGLLVLVVLWLFGYALGGASMTWAATHSFQMQVQTQCSYTRYPGLCVQSLKEFQDHPLDIMTALVNKTMSETRLPNSYFETLSSHLEAREAERVLSVTGSVSLICTPCMTRCFFFLIIFCHSIAIFLKTNCLKATDTM
jgi:hypothetical protein